MSYQVTGKVIFLKDIKMPRMQGAEIPEGETYLDVPQRRDETTLQMGFFQHPVKISQLLPQRTMNPHLCKVRVIFGFKLH
jgi:hypothetical protein